MSIGLCAALKQRGFNVQPFKKGPDYIDPLWLSMASSRPCYNLDYNTMSPAEISRMLSQQSKGADINVIEGNLGLYDGLALDGTDSNAAVAKLTQTPVVLVIDTRGVTRGVVPLLLGYQQFDPDIHIAGVIYNLSSGGRHEEKIRAVTEAYTDIPVLGVVKKNEALQVDERHLGLMPSNEAEGASHKINQIADIIANSVDLDSLMNIAKKAPPIEHVLASEEIKTPQLDTVRLGICEDSAFGFYYADDKEALQQAGAELVSINTLEDEKLPDDIDGLFIGGGFPETQMRQLEKNESMRRSIYHAIEEGLPTYAECGGLMYLSQKLYWNGQSASMVGIIPADVDMHLKPQGRGYVKLVETDDMPWPDDMRTESEDAPVINAHEFHYSSLAQWPKKGRFAYKVIRGVGITGEYDGWVYKNVLANYSHMRDTDCFHWAKRFVNFIRQHKNR